LMDIGVIDKRDLRPTRDIVFDLLRKAILNGKLISGERIMETSIAQELNISRTPVREAFRKLEAEGLIEYYPKKGSIVKGITKDDIIEIYEMREVLEGLATRLACKYIKDDEIRDLKDTLKQMEIADKNKEYDLFFSIHDKYNTIIIDAAGNKRLKNSLLPLYDYIASFRRITLLQDERRSTSLLDHKKIVELIELRDENKAEEYCRNHIRKAKETLLNLQVPVK